MRCTALAGGKEKGVVRRCAACVARSDGKVTRAVLVARWRSWSLPHRSRLSGARRRRSSARRPARSSRTRSSTAQLDAGSWPTLAPSMMGARRTCSGTPEAARRRGGRHGPLLRHLYLRPACATRWRRARAAERRSDPQCPRARTAQRPPPTGGVIPSSTLYTRLPDLRFFWTNGFLFLP